MKFRAHLHHIHSWYVKSPLIMRHCSYFMKRRSLCTSLQRAATKMSPSCKSLPCEETVEKEPSNAGGKEGKGRPYSSVESIKWSGKGGQKRFMYI